MKFLESFLQATVVIFAYPLVGSWVSQLIGEPNGSNYKDKGHNILTLLIFGALVLAILYAAQEIGESLFILIPASFLLMLAAAYRLSYEKDYELSWFVKSFSIKIVLALIIAFFMNSGK